MFKRFDPTKDISTSTQIKASLQRSIKSKITFSHPLLLSPSNKCSNNICLEPISLIDELLPKKAPLIQYKIGPHTLLYCRSCHSTKRMNIDLNKDINVKNVPSFFQTRNGPILPTLKLIHSNPQLQFKFVTVDKGAIPYILGGANIMCPGLTNIGSNMPDDEETEGVNGELQKEEGLKMGEGVVVYAEGKVHAIAVGIMKIGSRTIRSRNSGIAIEVLHYLGDGLYHTDELS